MNKYCIFGGCLLFPLLIFSFFGISCYVVFSTFFLLFLALELVIRLKNSKKKFIKQVYKFSDLYLLSHPNLPYVFAPNAICQHADFPAFPLDKLHCTYPILKIDSSGCPQLLGSEPLSPDRCEENRVSILGDSVIGSFLQLKDDVYHIPHIIKSELAKSGVNSNIKNCSVGGYTIQDILVKFILRDIFDRPSVVVVNSGYASIRSFFFKNYATDNMHFRNNFDKFYQLLQVRNIFPDFGLLLLKYVYQQFLPSNIRDDLLRCLSREGFDLRVDEGRGLDVFFENYQNLIYLAKSRGIEVMITTIPYFQYKKTEGHDKFYNVVLHMNDMLRALAIKNNISCVDLYDNFYENVTYFVDEAHLSPAGMMCAANLIANSLKQVLGHDNEKNMH